MGGGCRYKIPKTKTETKTERILGSEAQKTTTTTTTWWKDCGCTMNTEVRTKPVIGGDAGTAIILMMIIVKYKVIEFPISRITKFQMCIIHETISNISKLCYFNFRLHQKYPAMMIFLSEPE